MRTAEDIAAEFERRRNAWDPTLARMAKVRDIYNGDLVVPVDDEMSEPAVANLVLTGIDQTAGRIASVLPEIYCPALRPGIQSSEAKAQARHDVWKSWWQANRLPTMLRRRARYLIAYGTAPVVMGVDIGKRQPTWRVRNPLSVYPAMDFEDELVPTDVIVAVVRPAAWVREHYPLQAQILDRDLPDLASVTLLEYTDDEQISLVLTTAETYAHQDRAALLEFVPNRAGRPLSVIPQRVVLDRLQGQFDQMVGLYKAQARLTALSLIATDKAVFPDTYLVSRPGEVAHYVEGPFDGRTGQVNVVAGGDPTELQSAPGFNTNPMIDRLERAQRISAAVPAEFGGESTSNIRTGRRGDAVLSAVIDFPIMEAQEAFAEALTVENKMAAAIAKAWWGSQRTSIYLTARGKRVGREYTPETTFETDQNEVTYPVSGTDMNSLVVGMGQRIGLGTMSKRTAAEMDPLIDDPERETDRITSEQLDTAVLASIQQAAQAGSLPPQVIARVAELVRSGQKELTEAVDQATKEFAANQQAQQQQAAESAMPGMPPGELTQAGPSVQEAPQGMQNLAGLLRSLRNTGQYDQYQQATGQPVRT